MMHEAVIMQEFLCGFSDRLLHKASSPGQTGTNMNRTLKKILIFLTVFLAAGQLSFGQAPTSRNQADWYFLGESGNTPGPWNLWATARGSGFLWDDVTILKDSTTTVKPAIRAFLDLRADLGILDQEELSIGSRIVSEPWNHSPQLLGNFWITGKHSWPDNKKLRLNGVAAELTYRYSTLKNFASIAGYRINGTGFAADGIIVEGSTMEARVIYELDAISAVTWLPVKAIVNAGIRLPLNKEFAPFSQYLVTADLVYAGLDVDIFVEYALEAFFNSSMVPKKFVYSLGGGVKTWEVAFMENPMYVIPGVRFRYVNGMTLFAMVPLMLSRNVGSAMTRDDRVAMDRDQKFQDEVRRGISDPFDPWYAKWKIVAGITMPIIYNQTAGEMMRNYLLMKDRPPVRRMNIEEQLKTMGSGNDSTLVPVQDSKSRLDEIRKKREKAQEEAK